MSLHFNKGLAGAPAEEVAAARDTATNPAVLDAFALAIIAGGGPPAFPGIPGHEPDVAAARQRAGEIGKAMDELRKVVTNAGSYVSESDFFERSWQQSFWGSNYPRLAAVKKKYDPDRPLLRPSRRGQRRVERRWLHEARRTEMSAIVPNSQVLWWAVRLPPPVFKNAPQRKVGNRNLCLSLSRRARRRGLGAQAAGECLKSHSDLHGRIFLNVVDSLDRYFPLIPPRATEFASGDRSAISVTPSPFARETQRQCRPNARTAARDQHSFALELPTMALTE